MKCGFKVLGVCSNFLIKLLILLGSSHFHFCLSRTYLFGSWKNQAYSLSVLPSPRFDRTTQGIQVSNFSGSPSRVSFFCWRLLNGLLPLADVLLALGYHFPSMCPFCPANDFLDHAFVSCRVANFLWQWVADLLQVDISHINTLSMLFSFFWDNPQGVNFPSELLQVIPIFVCWIIWKQRNQYLFDGVNPIPARSVFLLKECLHNASVQHPFKVRHSHQHSMARFYFLSTVEQRRSSVAVSWNLPPPSWFKINVDGESERAVLSPFKRTSTWIHFKSRVLV